MVLFRGGNPSAAQCWSQHGQTQSCDPNNKGSELINVFNQAGCHIFFLSKQMRALHGNRFQCRANFTLMLTADNTRLHKETNRSRNYGGKRKIFLTWKKKKKYIFSTLQLSDVARVAFCNLLIWSLVIPKGKCLIYCKWKMDEEHARKNAQITLAVGTAPILHIQHTHCIHVQRVRLVQETCCYKLRFLWQLNLCTQLLPEIGQEFDTFSTLLSNSFPLQL